MEVRLIHPMFHKEIKGMYTDYWCEQTLCTQII